MKNLNYAYLLDFYGRILNERQREVLNLYYDDDLSLSEIAEITNISRQGAHDFIKRGEAKLTEAEAALGLAEKFENIKDTVWEIENLISKSDFSGREQILSLVEKLKNQV